MFGSMHAAAEQETVGGQAAAKDGRYERGVTSATGTARVRAVRTELSVDARPVYPNVNGTYGVVVFGVHAEKEGTVRNDDGPLVVYAHVVNPSGPAGRWSGLGH
mmetsp:Transcript_10567/g.15555  ORF Transcript_10567/g.15555 Transcript_10567/m.15555 type:complete len:104 (-) Transcript_10567:278-589(-)